MPIENANPFSNEQYSQSYDTQTFKGNSQSIEILSADAIFVVKYEDMHQIKRSATWPGCCDWPYELSGTNRKNCEAPSAQGPDDSLLRIELYKKINEQSESFFIRDKYIRLKIFFTSDGA